MSQNDDELRVPPQLVGDWGRGLPGAGDTGPDAASELTPDQEELLRDLEAVLDRADARVRDYSARSQNVRVWRQSHGKALRRQRELRRMIAEARLIMDAGKQSEKMVTWVVVAATSGVVGNAAYAALQRVVHDARKRRNDVPLEYSEAVLVARLAVCVRLRKAGVAVPDPDALELVRAGLLPSGTWDIRLTTGQANYYVAVPPGDPQSTPVRMHIDFT